MVKVTIKKLDKAAKVYEKIKTLDAEIIEIEKFAMMVANDETKTTLTLSVDNLTKKESKASEVKFDEDGSIISPDNSYRVSIDWSGLFGRFITKEKEETKESVLKSELTVNSVMAILGALLFEKQGRRKMLLDELEKIGVSI